MGSLPRQCLVISPGLCQLSFPLCLDVSALTESPEFLNTYSAFLTLFLHSSSGLEQESANYGLWAKPCPPLDLS